MQIPLTLSGPDNHMSPGSDVTRCPVPVQDSVTVVDGSATVSQQQFLFDTGAQVSVISPATATALGLDLKHPAGTMSVEGVGGAQDVPTFVVSAIEMPTTNGGLVQFTNVPVAVLNLAEGIEGVLGMNLFKGLSSMLYDPYGPGGAVLSFGSLVPPSGKPNNGSAPSPGQLSQLPPAWQNAVAGTSVFGFEFDSGVIGGRVYNDVNADGRIEGNESGLAGQVVYLDVHSDGRLDPGDLVTTTAGDGTFQFTGLTPGTYTVREVVPAGMLQSLAAPLAQTMQVANGRPVSVNFGNVTAASGANQAFVSGLYSTILDREPDSGGLAGWTDQLNAGVSRGTSPMHFGFRPSTAEWKLHRISKAIWGGHQTQAACRHGPRCFRPAPARSRFKRAFSPRENFKQPMLRLPPISSASMQTFSGGRLHPARSPFGALPFPLAQAEWVWPSPFSHRESRTLICWMDSTARSSIAPPTTTESWPGLPFATGAAKRHAGRGIISQFGGVRELDRPSILVTQSRWAYAALPGVTGVQTVAVDIFPQSYWHLRVVWLYYSASCSCNGSPALCCAASHG